MVTGDKYTQEQYIEHIIERCQLALDDLDGVTKEDFAKNQMLVDSTIMKVQTVGEAISNLRHDTTESTPEIDWKGAVGMRHILSHNYMGVSVARVYDTVVQELEPLKMACEKIREELHHRAKLRKDRDRDIDHER